MKVETFKVADWQDEETGLIIDENEEWILVKHIPVDFIIDGFKVYKKEFIEERTASDNEAFIERVLKLKGIKEDKPVGFTFGDTIETLKWAEKTYGLFEFQDMDQTELFYGRIKKVENDTLFIDSIKLDGELETDYEYEFAINEIRVITFETDYFNSIKLLWNDVNK